MIYKFLKELKLITSYLFCVKLIIKKRQNPRYMYHDEFVMSNWYVEWIMIKKLNLKMKFNYVKINYNTGLEFCNSHIVLIKYANWFL